MSAAFTVRFLPEDRCFTASAPLDLFLAAAGCEIPLEQPCGARGRCGRCRVRLVEGAASPTDADRAVLTEAEMAAGWRLGCRLVLAGAATVELPNGARSVAAKSFGDDAAAAADRQPVVRVLDLTVPEASLLAQESDIRRLARIIDLDRSDLNATPAALSELSRNLRASARLRAVIENDDLLATSATSAPGPFGLAVDLGSTTLAAALVRLDDARVEASLSQLNPQVSFGPDVMSRIHYSMEHPDGTERLMSAVRGGIAAMVRALIEPLRVRGEAVMTAAFTGNSTMLHLWLGVDPAPLGQSPYVGAWTDSLRFRAREVDLPIHPNGSVWVFPAILSHVGGDAVAAAVAVGMDQTDRPRLLIDLGTNSEAIVGCGDDLLAASTAAGPAFEGATIACGMRAAPGAIDALGISDDGSLSIHTVDHAPAQGLCGSGLVDAAAELLRVGVVDPSGLLRSTEELAGRVPDALRQRIFTENGRRAVWLTEKNADGAARVVLTALDIRQLQLAKGSIRAAVAVLCREYGIDETQLDQVLIAGVFGSFLRKSSLLRIGMIPAIDAERVLMVGNAAGLGARLALVDRRVQERALRLARRTRFVELAHHAGYLEAFHQALPFP